MPYSPCLMLADMKFSPIRKTRVVADGEILIAE